MEDKIFCPLADEKIDIVDCMENRETRDEAIPAKFKVKPSWRKICEECKYFKY